MPDEVKLYRSLFSRRTYLGRDAWWRKTLWVIVMILLLGLSGWAWLAWREPDGTPSRPEPPADSSLRTQNQIQRCCLSDIRQAQEALTRALAQAQKIRVQLPSSPIHMAASQQSTLDTLIRQTRELWDLLDGVGGGAPTARDIRDVRIAVDTLTELFCLLPRPRNAVLKLNIQLTAYHILRANSRASLHYIEGDIDMSRVEREHGHSYVVKEPFGTPGDSLAAPRSSTLRLYEDGVELGPAHSRHSDIRSSGQGRFSHWLDVLYFSSSDRSDPTTNRRRYTYRVYPTAPASPEDAVTCTAPEHGHANR